MAVFLQQLVNGISLGSVYALFALGFTLVFGVLEIINLAHPAVLAVGALLAYTLLVDAKVGLALAVAGACAGAGLLGVLLDAVAFRPLRLRGASRLSKPTGSVLKNDSRGRLICCTEKPPFRYILFVGK